MSRIMFNERGRVWFSAIGECPDQRALVRAVRSLKSETRPIPRNWQTTGIAINPDAHSVPLMDYIEMFSGVWNGLVIKRSKELFEEGDRFPLELETLGDLSYSGLDKAREKMVRGAYEVAMQYIAEHKLEYTFRYSRGEVKMTMASFASFIVQQNMNRHESARHDVGVFSQELLGVPIAWKRDLPPKPSEECYQPRSIRVSEPSLIGNLVREGKNIFFSARGYEPVRVKRK